MKIQQAPAADVRAQSQARPALQRQHPRPRHGYEVRAPGPRRAATSWEPDARGIGMHAPRAYARAHAARFVEELGELDALPDGGRAGGAPGGHGALRALAGRAPRGDRAAITRRSSRPRAIRSSTPTGSAGTTARRCWSTGTTTCSPRTSAGTLRPFSPTVRGDIPLRARRLRRQGPVLRPREGDRELAPVHRRAAPQRARWCIEGEEEIGSAGLIALPVARRRQRFAPTRR